MYTPSSTCSSVSASSRYGPMRQYCSGGSSIWSSIQPLPGVWSNGWLRKNANRPPARNTRATSAIAPSTSSMCSNTRHATTPSNDASGNGSRAASATRVVGTATALGGDAELVAGRVDPDDVGAASGEHPADLPVSTSHVEDHRRRRQLLVDERQDLFDVLGVGALGEALDPPAGVLLPQLAGRVACDRRLGRTSPPDAGSR